MTRPASPIRHCRAAPATDVAMCGARGTELVYANTPRAITCETCAAKRTEPRGVARAIREREARAAHFKNIRTRFAT